MNVSFGRVTAITGRDNKIIRINNKLQQRANLGQVVMKDVTSKYNNYSASSGMFAQAVSRGEKVEIYITGKDISKINKEWKCIDDIMANVSNFYEASKLSLGDLVEKIMKG